MSKRSKKLGKAQGRRKAGRRNLSERNREANERDPGRGERRALRAGLDAMTPGAEKAKEEGGGS